jgi:hypothetical protein
MFLTHGDYKFCLLVFWDSLEHAEAATGIIGPQLLPIISKIAKGPIVPIMYEVHDFSN